MALFKGELSLNDILYGLPYKLLIELRNSRLERLQKEQKDLEEIEQRRNNNYIRDSILRK